MLTQATQVKERQEKKMLARVTQVKESQSRNQNITLYAQVKERQEQGKF